MRRINYTILCISLFCTLSTGATAQNAPTAPSDAQVNHALEIASASYEDMVDPALTGNAQEITKLLADADKHADAVKKSLPADAASQFDALMQSLHKAADAANYQAVAENTVAIFHLLVENLKSDALSLPKELSLIDYAGYQLQVLAAAEKPDWQAMSRIATDTDAWWNAIATSHVTNRPLRDVVTSTVKGIKQAVQEQNLGMVKLAARIDLDLVDVLEGSIKKKPLASPTPK